MLTLTTPPLYFGRIYKCQRTFRAFRTPPGAASNNLGLAKNLHDDTPICRLLFTPSTCLPAWNDCLPITGLWKVIINNWWQGIGIIFSNHWHCVWMFQTLQYIQWKFILHLMIQLCKHRAQWVRENIKIRLQAGSSNLEGQRSILKREREEIGYKRINRNGHTANQSEGLRSIF